MLIYVALNTLISKKVLLVTLTYLKPKLTDANKWIIVVTCDGVELGRVVKFF